LHTAAGAAATWPLRPPRLDHVKSKALRSSGLALACLIAGGCQPAPLNDAVGSLGVALEIGPGVSITSASYAIHGPGDFERTGTVEVGNGDHVPVDVSMLPPGNGYTIDMVGVASDDSNVCRGSARFNIASGGRSTVVVELECHHEAAGAVAVTGSVNLCATLEGLGASPNQVLVGASLSLTAVAHDSDGGPQPLSYQWSATTGAFSSTTVAEPVFTCTSAGPATVTASVSDGDPNPICAGTLAIQVSCVSPSP
jgi:hypothetical protein